MLFSVPKVLNCCAEFIENHGLVDGIYRLSGVTSNIQRLRHAFDEDRVPALHSDESIRQDIHSVASLLKMYFRELPNPLCTYQLYSTFVSAVQATSDSDRLKKMRDAVRKLPPPHYRFAFDIYIINSFDCDRVSYRQVRVKANPPSRVNFCYVIMIYHARPACYERNEK